MLLQFHPWASAVEAPFWQVLTQRKMDVFKLDDSHKPVLGYYSTGQQVRVPGKDTSVALPARLCLGTDAFPDGLDPEQHQARRYARGTQRWIYILCFASSLLFLSFAGLHATAY